MNFSPDGNYVCISNTDSNDVSVFDVKERREVVRVKIGEDPKPLIVAEVPIGPQRLPRRPDELVSGAKIASWKRLCGEMTVTPSFGTAGFHRGHDLDFDHLFVEYWWAPAQFCSNDLHTKCFLTPSKTSRTFQPK